ncbi:MAG: hypothetical protein IJP70_04800 [Bacteroidales bacterium]|nr:hypothetical protein [Bacteroidales bacterium]
MNRQFVIFILTCLTAFGCIAQDKVYTLGDWKGLKADTLLQLNVSEYKLDYNHPLPYADMQKEWQVKSKLPPLTPAWALGVKPILWLTSNVNMTSDGTPQNKCGDFGGDWKGLKLQIDNIYHSDDYKQ